MSRLASQRLDRLRMHQTCRACGHLLGEPPPPSRSDAEIASSLAESLEIMIQRLVEEARAKKPSDRTIGDWMRLAEEAGVSSARTATLIAWMEAESRLGSAPDGR
jgi:hypothetical protein